MKTRKRRQRAGYFGNKTTQESIQQLEAEISNRKLKDVESIVAQKMQNAKKLREECKAKCINNICTKHDSKTCEQINAMIMNKTDYEWGNLCKIEEATCQKYLAELKSLEMYTLYVKTLNDKLQNMHATLFTNDLA